MPAPFLLSSAVMLGALVAIVFLPEGPWAAGAAVLVVVSTLAFVTSLAALVDARSRGGRPHLRT